MILFLTPDTTTVSRLTRACELEEDDFAHIGMQSLDLASRLRAGTAEPAPPPAVPEAPALNPGGPSGFSDNEHEDGREPLQGVEALSFIEDNDIELVVVGPDIDQRAAEALIGDIAAHHPLLPIVAFTLDTSNAFRSALRAGATEVATRSMLEQEIVDMIARSRDRNRLRLAASHVNAPPESATAAVLTVASPRGGVGRTLVATSIASLLHREFPGEVVLVDMSLQSGDVAALLALASDRSLSAVAARGAEFESADVKAMLSKAESGLHVLAAPQSLTAAVQIGPTTVSRALEILRESFRYVVIDTGPTISDESLACLDVTTHLLLVAAPDVPSVRAVGRMTDALDELQMSEPQRMLIINRATGRYGMPQRDIEAVVGLAPTVVIPAAKNIAMTMNMGEPFKELIHSRSQLARAFDPLLSLFRPTEAAPPRSSLWRTR